MFLQSTVPAKCVPKENEFIHEGTGSVICFITESVGKFPEA